MSMEGYFLYWLTWIVGISEIIFGFYFVATNSKLEIRRVMASLCFSVGLWSVLSAFISYSEPSSINLLATKLVFVLGAMVIISLLHVILVFPYKYFAIDGVHRFLMYVPTVIFSIIALFTSTVVAGHSVTPTSHGFVTPGELTIFFDNFLILEFVILMVILFHRHTWLDGIFRRNNHIFIVSVILGGLPGIVISLFLPSYLPHISISPLYANLSTGLWVLGCLFIISKGKPKTKKK